MPFYKNITPFHRKTPCNRPIADTGSVPDDHPAAKRYKMHKTSLRLVLGLFGMQTSISLPAIPHGLIMDWRHTIGIIASPLPKIVSFRFTQNLKRGILLPWLEPCHTISHILVVQELIEVSHLSECGWHNLFVLSNSRKSIRGKEE